MVGLGSGGFSALRLQWEEQIQVRDSGLSRQSVPGAGDRPAM